MIEMLFYKRFNGRPRRMNMISNTAVTSPPVLASPCSVHTSVLMAFLLALLHSKLGGRFILNRNWLYQTGCSYPMARSLQLMCGSTSWGYTNSYVNMWVSILYTCTLICIKNETMAPLHVAPLQWVLPMQIWEHNYSIPDLYQEWNHTFTSLDARSLN